MKSSAKGRPRLSAPSGRGKNEMRLTGKRVLKSKKKVRPACNTPNSLKRFSLEVCASPSTSGTLRLLEGHVVPHPRLGHLTDEVQGKALGPPQLPDDVIVGIKTHQLNGPGCIEADGRGILTSSSFQERPAPPNSHCRTSPAAAAANHATPTSALEAQNSDLNADTNNSLTLSAKYSPFSPQNLNPRKSRCRPCR